LESFVLGPQASQVSQPFNFSHQTSDPRPPSSTNATAPRRFLLLFPLCTFIPAHFPPTNHHDTSSSRRMHLSCSIASHFPKSNVIAQRQLGCCRC
jgi:hypothetical protein